MELACESTEVRVVIEGGSCEVCYFPFSFFFLFGLLFF